MHVFQRHLLPVGFVAMFLLIGCGNSTGSNAAQPPTPAVSLQVGAASYPPGSSISVTIKNQSGQTIYFADHRTNCTVLLLERQINNSWEPVAPCKLMIATRIHSLQAGASFEVKLTTSGQWPTGTYHARLDYSNKSGAGPGAPTIVYSSTFHLG